MQEAEDLVGVCHATDQGVPGSVLYTVAKSSKCEDDDEGRVRGMDSDDDVGNEMGKRAYEGDSTLTEVHVDCVVEKGRCSISNKGAKED